jgi:hypothetical protein
MSLHSSASTADRITWTGYGFLPRMARNEIEAFIGRKVMDVWAESVERCGGR